MIRVGVAQFDIRPREKKHNLERVVSLFEAAVSKGADIVCFSACCLSADSSNYSPEDLREIAEPLDGPSVAALATASRDAGSYLIAGSIFERSSDGLHDTSAVFSPREGLMGVYRRTHLYEFGDVKESELGLLRGCEYPVFDILGARVAVMIDVDLDFPEVARIYRTKGTDILFYPSHCGSAAVDSHRFMAASRAYENQMFFIDVNRVGHCGGELFLGASGILSPKGDVMASVGKFVEGVAVAEVDVSFAHRLQNEKDLLGERNLASYGTSLGSQGADGTRAAKL